MSAKTEKQRRRMERRIRAALALNVPREDIPRLVGEAETERGQAIAHHRAAVRVFERNPKDNDLARRHFR